MSHQKVVVISMELLDELVILADAQADRLHELADARANDVNQTDHNDLKYRAEDAERTALAAKDIIAAVVLLEETHKLLANIRSIPAKDFEARRKRLVHCMAVFLEHTISAS